MKLTLSIALGFAFLAIACNNKNDTRAAITAALKNVDTSINAGKLDNVAANRADSLMLAYINKYPGDTSCARLLFRAAQIMDLQKKFSGANKLLDMIVDKYPDSKWAPVGLYLNGFIYENEEFLLDKAKTRYELFLKKYPNDALAKSVQASLNTLGKSPEDIIKDFENKNPADTAKIPS